MLFHLILISHSLLLKERNPTSASPVLKRSVNHRTCESNKPISLLKYPKFGLISESLTKESTPTTSHLAALLSAAIRAFKGKWTSSVIKKMFTAISRASCEWFFVDWITAILMTNWTRSTRDDWVYCAIDKENSKVNFFANDFGNYEKIMHEWKLCRNQQKHKFLLLTW